MNLFSGSSNWIDVGMYDTDGHYKLVQMKYRLSDNKKSFRTVTLGFINDFASKNELFENVQEYNLKQE